MVYRHLSRIHPILYYKRQYRYILLLQLNGKVLHTPILYRVHQILQYCIYLYTGRYTGTYLRYLYLHSQTGAGPSSSSTSEPEHNERIKENAIY